MDFELAHALINYLDEQARDYASKAQEAKSKDRYNLIKKANMAWTLCDMLRERCASMPHWPAKPVTDSENAH